MSYRYETEKPEILTDDGQRMFLKIRDHVGKLLTQSGAVSMGHAMQGGGSVSTWEQMACVDRLVELGEIVEIRHGSCAAQHRIFRRPYSS